MFWSTFAHARRAGSSAGHSYKAPCRDGEGLESEFPGTVAAVTLQLLSSSHARVPVTTKDTPEILMRRAAWTLMDQRAHPSSALVKGGSVMRSSDTISEFEDGEPETRELAIRDQTIAYP